MLASSFCSDSASAPLFARHDNQPLAGTPAGTSFDWNTGACSLPDRRYACIGPDRPQQSASKTRNLRETTQPPLRRRPGDREHDRRRRPAVGDSELGVDRFGETTTGRWINGSHLGGFAVTTAGTWHLTGTAELDALSPACPNVGHFAQKECTPTAGPRDETGKPMSAAGQRGTAGAPSSRTIGPICAFSITSTSRLTRSWPPDIISQG